MKASIIACFALLISTAAHAQQSSSDVTSAQVNIYRAGLERGCRDAGRKRGDSQASVDSFCDCMIDTLKKSVTYEEWQQAYFHSSNKRDREEMLVMRPHMSKVQACTSPAAQASPAQPFSIVGKWQWTRSVNNCTEVYDYRPDGTLHVVSGAEITDSTYVVAAKPDSNGFHELKGQLMKTNGGRDCSDSASDHPMKSYTIYIVFHKTQPLHLVCETPALERCFGPLRRIAE